MVRFKNRYLLFEVRWQDGKLDETINEHILVGVLRDAVQHNFGDHVLGSLLSSLQVKYYNPYTRMCLIRCRRDHYQQVWCAATFLTSFKHRVVSLRLLSLSGTVAGAKAAVAKCNSASLLAHPLPKQHQASHEALESKLQKLDV